MPRPRRGARGGVLPFALLRATAPKRGGSIKLASTSATDKQPWLLNYKHIKYAYHPRAEGEEDDSDDEAEKEPIELGEGSFGRVFKGTYLDLPVAIKEVKFDSKSQVSFETEVQIVVSLHHPNIVACSGAAIKGKRGKMVLELLQVSLGDILHSRTDAGVQQYLASRGSSSLTMADKDDIATGIA